MSRDELDELDLIRLARSETTPSGVLERIARRPEMQWWVASNRACSPQLLDDLSLSTQPFVRFCVASNPSTSLSTLTSLARSIELDERKGVASNPSTSPELLEILADDSEELVRAAVAANRRTQSGTLGGLARDSSVRVRCAVASNSATPESSLEVLRNDPVAVVAFVSGLSDGAERFGSEVERLLNLEETPAEVIDYFADYEEDWIRELVLHHPNTSTETLVRIALDSELEIASSATDDLNKLLALVASHPNCPPMLLNLLSYCELDPREAVAANPRTPVSVLKRLAEDVKEDVRGAVAANPTTPDELLGHLANDPHWYVQKRLSERIGK